MPTSTLKILREVNDYTQDFIAEDVLGISQATYARIEQDPSRISAEQAQKLSDLYKVSIGNLLSEAPPVITFKEKAISGNTTANTNAYVQTQTIQTDDAVVKMIKEQNEMLLAQNAKLMDIIEKLNAK